ncbi:succinylglutamate desuccinylase/aspartoacylase family protein [Geminicoccaceae bacterium 1502E]|nr:succinylglutamate desuccinylase/aspartoacylase family protein [Geminicoccaceae bacterium 1502E]
MTRASRLSAEVDFNKDGKQTGFVRVPHSVHRSAYGWLPIPITCIKNGEGPRVLCVAGNHGDEWDGQLALMKLVRELTPERVRGRIVILSAANFPAVMASTRTSPIDGGNLNRSFPGDPDGGITAQIAYYIENVLLADSDYCIDLHSGGSSLMYIPSTLSRKLEDPREMERAIGLLKAFGAPYGYITDSPQGEDRTLSSAAARQNVLYLGTELGGAGTLSLHSIEVAEGGVRRALGRMGVLPEAADETPPETKLLSVRGSDYYVYAPDGGVFEPFVDLGDQVTAGQPAGAVHFPDTPWREPTLFRFQRDGMVLCKRWPSRCERGDCLFHLGTPWEA